MDSITVKDFRCFHDEQTARLAPLTLLVGENSTGKTSFMAMTRALRDFAFPQLTPFDFTEDPYDLGSFDEIAHFRGGRGGRATSFSAGFFVAPKRDGGDAYWFDVEFKKRGTIPFPMRRRLSSEEKKIWIEHRVMNGSGQLYLGTNNGEWLLEEDFPIFFADEDQIVPFSIILDNVIGIRFRSREGKANPIIRKRIRGSARPSNGEWRLVNDMYHSYRTSRFTRDYMYASAPVRSKPERTYNPSRPTRNPEGDYIPMYLASLYFQKESEWLQLKDALEDFGREAGLFTEISVKPLGKTMSEPFQLQVGKFGKTPKGPLHNLIDVGYGVNQALPIITELFRSDSPPMFLLQQPEVHLHPSAQAALGGLFCRVASVKKKLVIETHSDHLIDRIRMEVRDETTDLTHEDVSILYFERKGLDVTIHSLRLDEAGNVRAEDGVSSPPASYGEFFMETTKRLFGLEY